MLGRDLRLRDPLDQRAGGCALGEEGGREESVGGQRYGPALERCRLTRGQGTLQWHPVQKGRGAATGFPYLLASELSSLLGFEWFADASSSL